MKKIILMTALAAVALLAGCRKYNDTDIRNQLNGHEQRLASLEEAAATLKARLDAGSLIKSVTPITTGAGGWRIEFTGGTPSSIDIMNGAQGAPGVTPATPRIEVRTGADGSVSLWYNVGGEWTNTGVNIKGPQGGSGTPGTPGAAGVSPIVRVVDNGNGTITIQYNATAGYPAGGWTAAGDPISLGGNPRDKEAIFSIVEDDATGTITITLNDSDTPAERTVFEFAKASGAVRMEIVGFNDRTVIAEGRTAEIRFRVNPSDAWVPTGEGEAIAGKWQLDQTGTRSGYVNAPTDFELKSVAPASSDPTKEGEYIATGFPNFRRTKS